MIKPKPIAQVVAVEPAGPDGHGVNWLSGKPPKPDDLFGDEPKKASKVAKKPAKKAKRTSTAYSDGVNTWSGFGPKPVWLKAALEAGKTLEELKV